ncbi:MAG TPA: hypothetical protein VK824_01360, partial [Planctomycetota bacterium]|nr:hypothetical protein [Planctomycetota bacterium]
MRSMRSPFPPACGRRRATPRPWLALVVALVCLPGSAAPAPAPDLPALLDLPDLPALPAPSPRSSMLFADREEVTPAVGDYPPGTHPSAASAPALKDGWIPAADTGTGMPESFQYQLPSDYETGGRARPMLVAWHGFGSSARSVAEQTTLDEQCESWGWIYASVTGIDDALFGTPACQQ